MLNKLHNKYPPVHRENPPKETIAAEKSAVFSRIAKDSEGESAFGCDYTVSGTQRRRRSLLPLAAAAASVAVLGAALGVKFALYRDSTSGAEGFAANSALSANEAAEVSYSEPSEIGTVVDEEVPDFAFCRDVFTAYFGRDLVYHGYNGMTFPEMPEFAAEYITPIGVTKTCGNASATLHGVIVSGRQMFVCVSLSTKEEAGIELAAPSGAPAQPSVSESTSAVSWDGNITLPNTQPHVCEITSVDGFEGVCVIEVTSSAPIHPYNIEIDVPVEGGSIPFTFDAACPENRDLIFEREEGVYSNGIRSAVVTPFGVEIELEDIENDPVSWQSAVVALNDGGFMYAKELIRCDSDNEVLVLRAAFPFDPAEVRGVKLFSDGDDTWVWVVLGDCFDANVSP